MSAKYNHHIDSEISFTYIVNQKKLTLVAALGVTIGIAVYIFMSSMTAGFSRSTDASIFKTTPHIRIYKDDEISRSLIKNNANVNERNISGINDLKIIIDKYILYVYLKFNLKIIIYSRLERRDGESQISFKDF